jgi:hypothetical protein
MNVVSMPEMSRKLLNAQAAKAAAGMRERAGLLPRRGAAGPCPIGRQLPGITHLAVTGRAVQRDLP